jgi:Replication-relaxation
MLKRDDAPGARRYERPFIMSGKYDKLLLGTHDVAMGLFQLHIATAEQLCRSHYKPGCLKAVKARLKDLEDQGYVQHDVIPTKELRKPYYYSLDSKGARYLQKAGLDVHDAFRASKELDKHGLFLEHALELNDIVISAALVKGLGTGFFLYNFVHERTLRRRPYKVSWRANGRQETHNLIPDAFLDFRHTERRVRLPVLIEHDRATEAQQHFRRRIRAYIAFLQDQGPRKLFDVGMITIAFTTFAGEFRLAQMRQWAKQELATCDKAIGESFWFTATARPPDPRGLWFDPCWRSAYGDDKRLYTLLPLESL